MLNPTPDDIEFGQSLLKLIDFFGVPPSRVISMLSRGVKNTYKKQRYNT